MGIDRIKAKCIEDGDCLIWQGKTYESGAPAASEWIDGKDQHVGVRRRAYEEYNKVKLTPQQQVATCGHPGCLAKEHLKLSNASERSSRGWKNMDAATKLRRSQKLAARQQANRGKVTPEQVAAILESEEGPYVMAKKLGITGCVASRIKRGLSYRTYSANPFSGLGA